MTQKAIILLSGGLDSAANLAFAAEYETPVLAITLDYGQRAVAQELRAARQFCEYYGVTHRIIEIPWLGALGGSSLTDLSQKIPGIQSHQLEDSPITEHTARAVWVPNRNGIFIHVAAAFAERQDANRVIVGFNAEEAATFPDNSLNYLESVNQALFYSTSNHVKAFSYTAEWNKNRIVTELRRLKTPFPFQMIWSCYEGREQACETCESCQRLARALYTTEKNPGS